ncbi:photoreceptor ankyrin repeat protein [Paramormyrops kingsleyae]|uniref:photoreceptor ankyrin repeat protein n=1 Tax=Paramormyrops kingsleyae TaxID=1676925 RepID=UPI003B96DA18
MEDPQHSSGPAKETLKVPESSEDDDSGSVRSDNSVVSMFGLQRRGADHAMTLYQACARNEALVVREILRRGTTRQEVMEVDINRWNGLMVAAYKGFLEVVFALHSCPYLDINHQDKEGNTALMIAAQAGHVTILNYILNYYPGADMEIRDARGFTALIKAAMQGRSSCVIALLMAGADLNAVDTTCHKCAREWAQKTGRFETLQMLQRLHMQPQAQQFCETYVLEWPELKYLVNKSAVARSRGKQISRSLRSTFSFRFPQDPRDNGVLDHMVRMTTSIHSPLVVTGCRPLCPSSPPELGKRRLAVSELAQQFSVNRLEECSVRHSTGSISSSPPSVTSSACTSLASCCPDTPCRTSTFSAASSRVQRFISWGSGTHNSVFPAGCIPQIKVIRAGEATPRKEKMRRKTRGYLEPPKWKYREIKEDKQKVKENQEMEKREKQSSDRVNVKKTK